MVHGKQFMLAVISDYELSTFNSPLLVADQQPIFSANNSPLELQLNKSVMPRCRKEIKCCNKK